MEKEVWESLGFKKDNCGYSLILELQGFQLTVHVHEDMVHYVDIDEVKKLINERMKELKDYVRRYAR